MESISITQKSSPVPLKLSSWAQCPVYPVECVWYLGQHHPVPRGWAREGWVVAKNRVHRNVPLMGPCWTKANRFLGTKQLDVFVQWDNSFPHTQGFLQPPALKPREVKSWTQSHKAPGWQKSQTLCPPRPQTPCCPPHSHNLPTMNSASWPFSSAQRPKA